MLVRSNGEMTYFAADAAYYLNKRGRGFDRCIYLLGADHHGYIGRLKAIAACAGDDPDEHLEVLIGQLVSLVRAGEPVRMSKRAGTIITLDELVDAVGVDAARYTLARSSADSPLTLDIEVSHPPVQRQPGLLRAVRARPDRLAAAQRGRAGDRPRADDFDPGLLDHEQGAASCCGRSGSSRGWWRPPPSCGSRTGWRATCEELAGTYHRFYDAAGCCRRATSRPPT